MSDEVHVPMVVAAFLGMLTALGGVIRDVLTPSRPTILSREIHATAAIIGATAYAGFAHHAAPEYIAGSGFGSRR